MGGLQPGMSYIDLAQGDCDNKNDNGQLHSICSFLTSVTSTGQPCGTVIPVDLSAWHAAVTTAFLSHPCELFCVHTAVIMYDNIRQCLNY